MTSDARQGPTGSEDTYEYKTGFTGSAGMKNHSLELGFAVKF